MSRFGILQQQYRDSEKNWSDHWDHLVLCAEELADDFGLWLSRTESGHADQLCPPIPVKALGHLVDDESEDVFKDNILTGALGYTLNFAFEIRVSDGEHAKPPSVIRLKLAIDSTGEEMKVTVGKLGSNFLYRRNTVPENLFDELFNICKEELSV